MTHKQRVKLALRHVEPDRVPLDYYAREEVTARLKEHLGVASDEALLQRLGVDLRFVGPTLPGEASGLRYADPTVQVRDDGVHLDIWRVGFVPNATSSGFYMDLAYSPLRGVSSPDELEEHPWPSAEIWDYSAVSEQASSKAEYWVWAHSRGVFEISWFLRGFEEFMADLVLNPELANAVMDRVEGYLLERTRRILEAAGGLIDMVEYNDDVGGQNGMLLSPDLWRKFLKPRMARFVGLCRAHGARMRYHSCGGIRLIIPDLIEIGVDVLNPVQTLAAGMEPAALKRDFGSELTFNGGVDTQELLPHATPEEVREEVRRLVEILGAGGGFILAPSHVFQADVPVENVVAVYETALSRPL